MTARLWKMKVDEVMNRIENETYSGKTLTGDMTVTAGTNRQRRYVSIRIAASPGDAELHFDATVAEQLGKMLVAAAESTRAQ
ncbi:hypothetical protein [uncultured Bradyrhizobium sp.]|uniref:hypothetical protein n=1 Tax=uncultured Bradyrhizobium sp. TaxID=199684 RepID=UPI0035C9BE86